MDSPYYSFVIHAINGRFRILFVHSIHDIYAALFKKSIKNERKHQKNEKKKEQFQLYFIKSFSVLHVLEKNKKHFQNDKGLEINGKYTACTSLKILHRIQTYTEACIEF